MFVKHRLYALCLYLLTKGFKTRFCPAYLSIPSTITTIQVTERYWRKQPYFSRIISSIIYLINSPSDRREGSSNPLRPSSARARQPPCHEFSVSWNLENTEKKEPSEPALILMLQTSKWSHAWQKSWLLTPGTTPASNPYLKQSRTEPTTSSASSLGSLPVTLPILHVKKRQNNAHNLCTLKQIFHFEFLFAL